MQLQSDLEKLSEVGVTVVGVSYDPVETLKSFADSADVTFHLLADPDSEVIEAYGLLNDTGRAKLAHPATILVGQDGTIKDKLYEDGYRQRHANEALIEAAEKLQEE